MLVTPNSSNIHLLYSIWTVRQAPARILESFIASVARPKSKLLIEMFQNTLLYHRQCTPFPSSGHCAPGHNNQMYQIDC